ncbi:MAG: hypothetical protein CME70_04860 [Halobacteriovorax sp.]|nr:hypothetical protein [Halobacteriovorax sp.]
MSMRLKDLEIYLNRQQPDFYQFAMALTADEDLSEKLIKDAQYLLLAEEREELSLQLESQNSNPTSFFRFSRTFILSTIFRIARKNNLFQPPREGYSDRIEHHAFWTLPMDHRAVLCLRHKLRFSKEEVTEILDITKVEYFNLLNLARESLLKNSGGTANLAETY